MKIGMRKPSIKKSISARTTGKAKRKVKKAVIPGYGKKVAAGLKTQKRLLTTKYTRKLHSVFGIYLNKKSPCSNTDSKPYF